MNSGVPTACTAWQASVLIADWFRRNYSYQTSTACDIEQLELKKDNGNQTS
jgi:hypothetical protein